MKMGEIYAPVMIFEDLLGFSGGKYVAVARATIDHAKFVITLCSTTDNDLAKDMWMSDFPAGMIVSYGGESADEALLYLYCGNHIPMKAKDR